MSQQASKQQLLWPNRACARARLGNENAAFHHLLTKHLTLLYLHLLNPDCTLSQTPLQSYAATTAKIPPTDPDTAAKLGKRRLSGEAASSPNKKVMTVSEIPLLHHNHIH